MSESTEAAKDFDCNEEERAVADVIFRLGSLSYEMETARYDSLLSATSHLMSFISIESIALLTLLPTLLSFHMFSGYHIVACYITIFAVLLATLVVALIARYRFQYTELESPKKLGDYASDNVSKFESASDVAAFYCASIEESYASVCKRNERMSKLVKVATVLAIVNIGLIAISALSFVVVAVYYPSTIPCPTT